MSYTRNQSPRYGNPPQRGVILNIPKGSRMNQLKTLRKERHISQADIAARLGIQPAAVSKYETGRVPLSEGSIEKLCDILNVSADELLGRAAAQKSADASAMPETLKQVFPADMTVEDLVNALLTTISKQKKQMEQTVRNLNACGIPNATIARVTALSEAEIQKLLEPQ